MTTLIRADIEITKLRDAISSVIHAASTDKERPGMNAVFLDVALPRSKAIATDGVWVAERKFEIADIDTPGQVAISTHRAKKLLALLDAEMGEVHLSADDSLVRFEVESTGRVDCSPVEQFPPTGKVWPTGSGSRISEVGMSPKLLAKIGKAFGCSKGHGIHFSFFGENAAILVHSEATPEMRVALMPIKQLKIEFDAASERVDASDGKPLEVTHRGQKLKNVKAAKGGKGAKS